ncbi:VOC family protein, partial [Pseudomonas aeruginosa]|nr:VOC family protein [Pseudomonas aeruginosa]
MSDRPARPSRLNGLRHLALLVPNLEECERFYIDVLGMEVLNRANEDLVYLTCGNDNLSLGRAHVEFVCQDADGAERLMRRLRFADLIFPRQWARGPGFIELP